MKYPSIFNDVLGPVMRGPSSSHCAAALRIGRLCRDLVSGSFKNILIEFDPNGSLATTHKGQGSDMGLFSGFMGWDAHDDRLPFYEDEIAKMGWDINIVKHAIGATHPNTYQMTFANEHGKRSVTAISTGGGMIEVIEIDGTAVSIFGDYHELLVYGEGERQLGKYLKSILPDTQQKWHQGKTSFVLLKSEIPYPKDILKEIEAQVFVNRISVLSPVLPILSSANESVPFSTCDEMLDYCGQNEIDVVEAALIYESIRGNLTKDAVYQRMESLLEIMQTSIQKGLSGTTYEDRILGSQSAQFQRKMEDGDLVKGDVLNQIILYVSAMMEVKSSMGIIIAAPTAGACGALPGAILGMGEALDLSRDTMTRGLLAAGIIGVFIAHQASFAAEVGGCQAECGSGSCMAAAGLVIMQGGSTQQAVSAASQALQNSLGMICDPIANRVEAPCLGKNVMAASNALSCANMAISNYDHLIPLDQVIQTMARVSKQMAHELRCTALGGLSITKAAKEIEARLEGTSIDEVEEDLAAASQRFKIC